jgi:hypothetical protein
LWVTSVQQPAVISHHADIPSSLVSYFHLLYVLMKPLSLLLTNSSKIFWKVVQMSI